MSTEGATTEERDLNLMGRMIPMKGGKEYLQVADRIVWFRRDYPEGTIETTVVSIDEERGSAIMRARVTTGQGGIAEATGDETRGDFPAGWIGKAETKAVGRALGYLGYGTASAGFEEGPRVVDAPVAQSQRQQQPPPAPTPVKVEDWTDEQILTKLGSKLKDEQYQRLAVIYIGRATDRDALLARTKAAMKAGPPADGYKAMVAATATARGDALGLPRKGAAPAPPADDLTEIVGEPEHPQARRIANIRVLATQAGWDEARLTSMARNLYGTDDLTRWSGDQLVSLEQFIRAGNHAAAAG